MTDTMPEKILVTNVIKASDAWQPVGSNWVYGAYKNYPKTEYTRSDKHAEALALIDKLVGALDKSVEEFYNLEEIRYIRVMLDDAQEILKEARKWRGE